MTVTGYNYYSLRSTALLRGRGVTFAVVREPIPSLYDFNLRFSNLRFDTEHLGLNPAVEFVSHLNYEIHFFS